jgi:hypothetical protein
MNEVDPMVNHRAQERRNFAIRPNPVPGNIKEDIATWPKVLLGYIMHYDGGNGKIMEVLE